MGRAAAALRSQRARPLLTAWRGVACHGNESPLPVGFDGGLPYSSGRTTSSFMPRRPQRCAIDPQACIKTARGIGLRWQWRVPGHHQRQIYLAGGGLELRNACEPFHIGCRRVELAIDDVLWCWTNPIRPSGGLSPFTSVEPRVAALQVGAPTPPVLDLGGASWMRNPLGRVARFSSNREPLLFRRIPASDERNRRAGLGAARILGGNPLVHLWSGSRAIG